MSFFLWTTKLIGVCGRTSWKQFLFVFRDTLFVFLWPNKIYKMYWSYESKGPIDNFEVWCDITFIIPKLIDEVPLHVQGT